MEIKYSKDNLGSTLKILMKNMIRYSIISIKTAHYL